MSSQTLLRLLIVLAIVVSVQANWALLVSASRGYENYRHQADVFASYHLLRHQGYPSDRIIVMAYDDIASDPLNPFGSELYHQPSTCTIDTDIRKGVRIDYSGKDVTPAIFEAVLTGNKAAVAKVGTSRTVVSLPTENIFVYFTGVGGRGRLHFPSPAYTEFMSARKLVATLERMRQKQRFSQLLFFLDASYSESVFVGLKNSSRVLAVASAQDHACPVYPSFPPHTENKIKGSYAGTFLSDDFSTSWLNYALRTTSKEPIGELLSNISSRMKFGRAVVYGDMSLLRMETGCFLYEGKEQVGDCNLLADGSNKAVEVKVHSA